MSPVLQLLRLPQREMPTGNVLLGLSWLASMAALAYFGEVGALVLVGFVGMFWNLLAGTTLRSVLRPEALLLPRFRRHLAVAGAVDAAVCVVLPMLVVVMLGARSFLALAAAGLLFAASLGVAAGLGARIVVWMWLPLMAALGLLPRSVLIKAREAFFSPLLPVVLVLGSALVVALALRPFLSIRDADDAESPLQGVDSSAVSGPADALPRHRGTLNRHFALVLDATARRTFDRALRRFGRRATSNRETALVRALLLPHDNYAAVLVRLGIVAGLVVLYFLAFARGQHWDAGLVGAYAVILGISRVGVVGRGMLRLRPNLADLYLTLAPPRHRDFQSTLARVLSWLISTSLFSCLAYGVLIAVVLHAVQPARLLLAVAVTAIGASLGALSAQLVGPESNGGRLFAQMCVIAGAVAVYVLVYWLLGRLGLLYGSIAALLLTLPFGIGVWHAAREQYLAREPDFDAAPT